MWPRKVRLLLFSAVGICILYIMSGIVSTRHSQVVNQVERDIDLSQTEKSENNVGCVQPELQVYPKELGKHFKRISPLVCDGKLEWVEISGSIAKISERAIEKYGEIKCNFSDIIRIDDSHNQMGDVTSMKTEYQLSHSDFVAVKCTAESSKQEWKNIVAGIRKDADIAERSDWRKVPEDGLKLNVLMFGFDSISRVHFIRKLPKTYKYMMEKLNAIVMKGYNIVGDGTPQALIPILTGQTETELPDTRKRMGRKATFVNVYPWVWNEYKNNGYVTAYLEDCASIGTFTYRLKGFNQVPTDHFMRAFYLEYDNNRKSNKYYCLRNTPSHKIFMNYATNFFQSYRDKPKFMFAFHGELSHSDLNMVEAADEDLLEMVQGLHEGNMLNDTLLIIMSDHGARFTSIRETQQGKQEERNPMFSYIFPPWFSTAYPEAYNNFIENSNVLTTPFDVHATLRNVLHFTYDEPADLKNRSINLFQKIPKERTCEDAMIEPHWCSCLSWNEVPNTDPMIQEAAQAAVDFFNGLTESDRDICETLTLSKVVWAAKFIPNADLLRFKQNADKDGFVPDLTDNTKVSVEIYQIHLHTNPGDGHFEVSITRNVKEDTYDLKGSEISRVNKYGSQADCLQNHNLEIRKYCYCK